MKVERKICEVPRWKWTRLVLLSRFISAFSSVLLHFVGRAGSRCWRWRFDSIIVKGCFHKALCACLSRVHSYLWEPTDEMSTVNISANHWYITTHLYVSYFTHHITMTLHIYELTFISEGGEDGGGVTGEKAAKPVTTVGDCVLTFVSATPLDILQGNLGTIYSFCLWLQNHDIFIETSGPSPREEHQALPYCVIMLDKMDLGQKRLFPIS